MFYFICIFVLFKSSRTSQSSEPLKPAMTSERSPIGVGDEEDEATAAAAHRLSETATVVVEETTDDADGEAMEEEDQEIFDEIDEDEDELGGAVSHASSSLKSSKADNLAKSLQQNYLITQVRFFFFVPIEKKVNC